MALHPQITCRQTEAVQCSAHANMNVTKQQYNQLISGMVSDSPALSPSVVLETHSERVGKLLDSYSFTVSVGWINLYYVSVHSPTCLWIVDNFHGRRVVLAVNHAHRHVSIPEYTEHFRAYTDLRNKGATNVGQWYIHTHNYSACGGRCHDQCGACSGSPWLSQYNLLYVVDKSPS